MTLVCQAGTTSTSTYLAQIFCGSRVCRPLCGQKLPPKRQRLSQNRLVKSGLLSVWVLKGVWSELHAPNTQRSHLDGWAKKKAASTEGQLYYVLIRTRHG